MTKFLCTAWAMLITAVLTLSVPAVADAPLVYATIEPAQITLGQSARYTITNLGNGTDPVKLPVVSGLTFEIMGRTQQIEIINGTTLASRSIVVRVTPQMAGIFSIPGVTPKAPPLVLQVNVDHFAPAPQRSTGNAPAPIKPPIFAGATLPEGVRLTPDGSAFVRLSVPKREIYVGESVPVEIEVGMRSGFVTSLNGLPKLSGEDFTLTNLSRQPAERSEKIIGGMQFVVWTWNSVLAVVKPGAFSMSAEAPLTVRVRTRSRQDQKLDDEFGDPFLQNLFGTTIPKEITVESPATELTVLALPTEGRPADFHGAIGNFKVASDISPATAAAGDPMTLHMHVTGAGNFDRVDSPMLEHLDQWKTYPPKSTFNPSDAIGYKGEKSFEQPLIASKPGKQIVPGVAFSYFDPGTRRYETLRSSPLTVAIAPALADSTLSASQVAANSEANSANPLLAGLRPDQLGGQETVDSLLPVYLKPGFLAIPSLLALVFAGGLLGVRWRKEPSPAKGPDSRAVNRVLAQLGSAARAGDSALFFSNARAALQKDFAVRWQLAPERITATELTNRLGSEADDVRQLFALADESKYSGHALKIEDFTRWMQIVRGRLMAKRAP
jgi:hypothetical protein